MKLALLLAAPLALAGCHAEESAANRALDSERAAAAIPAEAPVAKPVIPERYRGVWAESRAACAPLAHPSRLVIGDDSLRFPGRVIQVETVSERDNGFAVTGRDKKSGATAQAIYTLDVTGNILTVGESGAQRVRCG